MLVSLITSQSPNVIAKNIDKMPDGTLRKTSTAYMMRGSANIMPIDTLEQFNGLLDQLMPCHALAFGVPSTDNALIVKASDLHKNPGAISRSDKYFAWPKGEGMLFLDYDPDAGEQTMQPQALLDTITTSLGPCGMLWRPSASGFIYDADTGEELDGLKGQHVYIPVADASDIPRAGAVLFKRLWLAGHGRIVLAQNGAMLVRSLVDGAVWQPSRLDFAAGAVCGPGIVRKPPQGVVAPGAVLDTRKVLPELSAEEDQRYRQLVEKAKNNSAPQSANVREAYIIQRAQAEGVSVEAVRARYEMAEQMSVLCGDFPIEMAGGAIYSVAHILANPADFHEKICLDPIEPEYNNRHPVGKLYLDSKGTFLDSKAHGGRVFVLGIDTGEAFKAAAKEGNTFQEAMKTIRQSGGELDDVESIARHITSGPFSPFQRAALTSELEGQLKENKRLTPAIKAMIEGNAAPQDGDVPARTHNPIALPELVDVERIPYQPLSNASAVHGMNAIAMRREIFRGRLAVIGGIMRWWSGSEWQTMRDDVLDRICFEALLPEQSKLSNVAGTKAALRVTLERRDLPAPSKLIFFANGVFDPTTGDMVKHDSKNLNCGTLKVQYTPNVQTPEWDAFLSSIFGAEPERTQLWQEVFGWCLIGHSLGIEKCIALDGVTRAGKGVILSILMDTLGEGVCGTANFSGLADGKIQTVFTRHGVVVDTEAKSPPVRDWSVAVGFVNKLTANEPVTIPQLNKQDPWVGRLNCKFIFACNGMPRLSDDSAASAGRNVILRFDVSFFDKEDRGLRGRLLNELSGITAWAVVGLQRLIRNGGRFTMPESSIEAAGDLNESTQPLREFVDMYLQFDDNVRCHQPDMWDAYRRYCIEANHTAWSRSRFYSSLKQTLLGTGAKWSRGVRIGDKVARGYTGIGVAVDMTNISVQAFSK